jgi:hypothetical protein
LWTAFDATAYNTLMIGLTIRDKFQSDFTVAASGMEEAAFKPVKTMPLSNVIADGRLRIIRLRLEGDDGDSGNSATDQQS